MVKTLKSQKEENVIDLRERSAERKAIISEKEEEIFEDEPEFKISSVEEGEQSLTEEKVSPLGQKELEELKTSEKVKVKFDKFVNLVMNHTSPELLEVSRDEDVIVSTNLLTDLANAGKSGESKKLPLVFLVGIVLGLAVAWILLRT